MKIVRNWINSDGRKKPSHDHNWNIDTSYDSNGKIIQLKVITFSDRESNYMNSETEVVETTVQYEYYQFVSETMSIDTLKTYDHAVFAFVTDSNYTPIDISSLSTIDEANSSISSEKVSTDPLTHTSLLSRTQVVDLFRQTSAGKLRRPEYNRINNTTIYGFLVVPFADSTPDEMTFVVNSSISANVNITTSGFSENLPDIGKEFWDQQVSNPIPVAYDGWMDLLPKISTPNTINVSTNSTTDFDVQLVDSNNNPIAREGVTIYLENTGGNLALQRVITDANGASKVTVISGPVPGTFKIKTGFKYFSGVSDTIINVS